MKFDEQANDQTKNALMDRAFLDSSKYQKPVPLGASSVGQKRPDVVAMESEIRDGAVYNGISARRAELDYNVMKRTQGMGGIMKNPLGHMPEFRFK
jgi:hypothetical protein